MSIIAALLTTMAVSSAIPNPCVEDEWYYLALERGGLHKFDQIEQRGSRNVNGFRLVTDGTEVTLPDGSRAYQWWTFETRSKQCPNRQSRFIGYNYSFAGEEYREYEGLKNPPVDADTAMFLAKYETPRIKQPVWDVYVKPNHVVIFNMNHVTFLAQDVEVELNPNLPCVSKLAQSPYSRVGYEDAVVIYYEDCDIKDIGIRVAFPHAPQLIFQVN